MKDELYEKIVSKLSGSLDGDLFEECAVDLLQQMYPSLVPNRGGSDDGQDGYFPSLRGENGPLVCTTSERVADNLRKNLKRYIETGHNGHSAVLATSRPLTQAQKNRLDTVAKKEGFELVAVHEQSDFANRLYRDRVWLKKLLGLESNQQALSIFPVTSRPVISTLVRGREDLMDWLNRPTGDVLIVGQPGSGKTFAVQDFAAKHDGLFVVSNNADQIIAEVRDKHPVLLIVDDAHQRVELLQSLRQMRQDAGADYRIVATSWLSHRNEIRECLVLGDDSVFELRLLSRDTMVQIINDCGVAGPDSLVSELVTQAEGKPGLAATLSQAVLRDGVRNVYVGETLGKHLDSLLRSEVGTEAMRLLAVAALGGDSGISLSAAATILDIPPLSVQDCVRDLAFGGVIKEVAQDRISVRPPPLRPYLVKQRFFGAGANVDPYSYLNRYPNMSDVAGVILGAALTGGKVDEERLYRLIEETGPPSLFGNYARLGHAEAEQVLAEHPKEALQVARELLDIYPEGILPLMLDAAVTDNRPMNSYPEHPMRVIGSWCKDMDYNNAVVIENRDKLLGALAVWNGWPSQERVAAQALAAAFTPRIECLRSDPGSGTNVTFMFGHLATKGLRRLIDLLRSSKGYFMVSGVEGLNELIGLLHDWTYEMPMPGETIDADQHSLMQQGASIILDYIGEAATDHPGIQARLKQYAHELGQETTCKGDVEYETIFPLREGGSLTWKQVEEQQREASLLLAANYVRLSPTDVIRRLTRYSSEARDTGTAWPNYMSDIVSYLADHVSNLGEWARSSVRQSDDVDLSYPLLARYYSVEPTEAEALLTEAFDHPSHRSSAARVIIMRFPADGALWNKAYQVLKEMNMGWWVYGVVARREVGDQTILALLDHPSDRVAMMAAAAFEQACDGAIPPSFLNAWEAALIGCPLTGSPDDSMVGTALKRHPDATVRWLMARAAEDGQQNEDTLVDMAKTLIPGLSQDQRREVIRALRDTSSSRLLAGPLVGDDPHLFQCLLDNRNAAAYRLHVLSNVAGPVWRTFVEIAVKNGLDDASIESACTRLSDGWTGPASQHLLELMKGYEDGLSSSEPRVAAIARKRMDILQKESDRELKREGDEDIYGR